jgi:hypothetical protein
MSSRTTSALQRAESVHPLPIAFRFWDHHIYEVLDAVTEVRVGEAAAPVGA